MRVHARLARQHLRGPVAAHDLTGVLLVGGASRRFGSPKALARIGDETLTPFLLLYLLAHPQVKAQYEHKTFYETIIWNVADRWRQVLLPIPRSADVRQTINDRVRSVIEKRRAGLLEMKELWERPVLPYSEEPELVPALDVIEETLPDALGLGD